MVETHGHELMIPHILMVYDQEPWGAVIGSALRIAGVSYEPLKTPAAAVERMETKVDETHPGVTGLVLAPRTGKYDTATQLAIDSDRKVVIITNSPITEALAGSMGARVFKDNQLKSHNKIPKLIEDPTSEKF